MSTPANYFRLKDYVPSIYRNFLPALFDRDLPSETRATCHDCVMCSDHDDLPAAMKINSFDSRVKCCTYHPSLPNFLAGAILASPDSRMQSGRERLSDRIAHGVGITPRGVVMPKKYAVLYEQGHNFFGRSQAMSCPYLSEGQCTIWQYREAVCTTYFCKFLKGPRGKQFWEELKRYLTNLEIKLALYAIQTVEQDPKQLAKWWAESVAGKTLNLEDIDGLPAPESQLKELWDGWRHREPEFYIKCYEAIINLTREQFEKLIGIEEHFLRQRLELALEENISDQIPSRLRRNPELRVIKQNGNYLCASETNRGDVVELNALFYPLLDYFDGGSDSKQVIKLISSQAKVEIPDELLQKLFHIGILVEAS